MGTAITTLPSLVELYDYALEILAPIDADDPPVHSTIDAVTPPALVVVYDDPLLTFETPCLWQTRLAVATYASRLEPDAGMRTSLGLVEYVLARMSADALSWPHETSRAPRMVEYNAIPMLTARVLFTPYVSLGGA